MRPLNIVDAKRVAAGLKGALPDDLPITVEATVHINNGDDDIVVKMEGIPPFLTVTVLSTEGTKVYHTHPEMPPLY